MKKERFIKSMTTVLSVVGLFLMIYFILKKEYKEDQDYEKMEAVYLESDAVMILQRAELLLEENNYDEAIKQYTIALAMNNDNDEIRQEIARAYKKQCLLTDEGCENAILIYNFLIRSYPGDDVLLLERLELHQYLDDSVGIAEDEELLMKANLESIMGF
jgi:tetratricopeptide (TPR) repeat protein